MNVSFEAVLPETFFCVSDPSNVGGGDDSDEPGGDERVKAVVADHVRVAGLVVGVKLKKVAYCSVCHLLCLTRLLFRNVLVRFNNCVKLKQVTYC